MQKLMKTMFILCIVMAIVCVGFIIANTVLVCMGQGNWIHILIQAINLASFTVQAFLYKRLLQ